MDFSLTKDIRLEELMPVIRESLIAGNSVRLFPKGTSMLPMIRQGIDSVVLSPVPDKLKKYDLPFYQRDNGQYVLHRIVEAGETYTCIGDNQFVFERGVRHDQMIAIVTAFYRRDKKISVNHISYRLYCFFWHYSRVLRRYWRAGVCRLRRLFS